MEGLAFLSRPVIEVAYGNPRDEILLRITPLRVRQIPLFQNHFKAVIESTVINNPGADISIDIAKMIESDRDNLLAAAAIAADKPEAFIAKGSLAHFIVLVDAVLSINKDFIFAKGAPPKKPTNEKTEEWNWADCIQFLVRGGHRLHDVLDYTYAELMAYSAALSKQERHQHLAELINLRAAQYDEKNFKKYLEGLNHG